MSLMLWSILYLLMTEILSKKLLKLMQLFVSVIRGHCLLLNNFKRHFLNLCILKSGWFHTLWSLFWFYVKIFLNCFFRNWILFQKPHSAEWTRFNWRLYCNSIHDYLCVGVCEHVGLRKRVRNFYFIFCNF